jgi:hypothetical protein
MTLLADALAKVEGSTSDWGNPMDRTMYEIRVAGTVPEEDLQDMGAVRFAPDQVNTVLYGVSDETALYGLLARLRALGIDVVEVRRVPGFSGPTGGPGEADRGEAEHA